MLIALIVLLIIMDIALRLLSVGVELSYQVGKRVDAIREKSMDVAEDKVNNKYIKSSIKVSNTLLEGVEPAMKLAKKVSKNAIKGSIKLTQWVIRILKDALIAAEALVIIVDIIVFIVLVVVAYFYLSFLGG